MSQRRPMPFPCKLSPSLLGPTMHAVGRPTVHRSLLTQQYHRPSRHPTHCMCNWCCAVLVLLLPAVRYIRRRQDADHHAGLPREYPVVPPGGHLTAPSQNDAWLHRHPRGRTARVQIHLDLGCTKLLHHSWAAQSAGATLHHPAAQLTACAAQPRTAIMVALLQAAPAAAELMILRITVHAPEAACCPPSRALPTPDARPGH